MKTQISFDEWMRGLEVDEAADLLVELPVAMQGNLMWALYTGRNDLIVEAKKSIMRELDDRYQWLVDEEDPSVVIWEDYGDYMRDKMRDDRLTGDY